MFLNTLDLMSNGYSRVMQVIKQNSFTTAILHKYV